MHAIVLRRRDSGESDRRLTILSRESGKIDVTAKGARKGGSRLAGSSDPMTIAKLGLASGKRNVFVTQAQPIASFRGLRSNYDRLSFGLALCELYAAILPWEEEAPEAFDLLEESLGYLDGFDNVLAALIWAELKLLTLSGYLPAFDRSAVDGSAVGEADPWFSAHAGGYVGPADAERYTDRIQTRAEVLFGLAATAALDAPPPKLKYAEESLGLLLSYWRQIAETSLPANEACVAEVRHSNP